MKTIRLAPLLALCSMLLAAGARAQTITTKTLDYGSNGDVGEAASMAIVNGNPAIAYYNHTDTSLMFARNSAADGSGTWQITTVRSTNDVGTFASLAVVNGNPAICYYENISLTGGLKYVRALDANGTSWGVPVTVDSDESAGWYTSLMVVNGNPAISYYNSNFQDLLYVRALDASGTSWGTPMNLDSTGAVGLHTSLEIVDGNPAISYHDQTNTNLKYIRATNASGTSWSAPVVVDGATSSVGRYSSLEVVDGNPAICYQDSTIGKLKYVRATDAGGTAWGVPVILGDLNQITSGRYTSLTVINGRPTIAYYDQTNSDLNYVRANDITGAVWGASVTVASSGSVGIYPSMVVVAGNPAISYYNSSAGNLEYVRALDANGASWAVPITADDGTQSGLVGLYTSQAIVAGTPAISYYDDTSDNLKFVRAISAEGTNWYSPVIVDTGGAGFVGLYTSLAVVNGNPAISYYDATNGNLNYVRASDAVGTSWNTPVSVDITGNVGQYTSLAIVAGNPAISYYDTTNGNLNYVRASDASGATWGTPVIVDITGNVGQHTSLTVVNGNPAISYYDITNGNLKYVRASDTSGATWGTPVHVDTGGAGNVGTYTSLRVINGNPAISYFDESNTNLKYVRASDTSGASWGTPASLDSTGTVGSHTSMAVINGNPAISYYDDTNDDLKYVRALDASGASWGTPVVMDGNGNVGSYTSLVATTGGNPAISYYDIDSGNLMWATITSPNPDSDGDGLLDSWELTYWPTITGHSALDDFDHDGYVELFELALGLNPTLSNPGGLPGMTTEGGYLTLTLTKQPGVTYEVQSAGTLLPSLPDSFGSASTVVLINDATTLKVRDNVLIGTPPSRFIRAKVTAAP